MRVSPELDHLIKSDSLIATHLPLPTHLAAIEKRKALEIEHYLRACAVRLELLSVPTGVSFEPKQT